MIIKEKKKSLFLRTSPLTSQTGSFQTDIRGFVTTKQHEENTTKQLDVSTNFFIRFDLFTVNWHCSASPATIYTLRSQSSLCVFVWDSENKPKNGGICVANHTSPIDVIILASDGCYAMVSVCVCVCFLTGTVVGVCEKEALKGLIACVCYRWVRSMGAWWGSFRSLWWKLVHTFGLSAQKSKIAI